MNEIRRDYPGTPKAAVRALLDDKQLVYVISVTVTQVALTVHHRKSIADTIPVGNLLQWKADPGM